jgi:cytidylate kinase
MVGAKGEDSMPLITISQRIGSGGEAVAELVADGLDLELLDDKRLQREARKMGIRPEATENIDDKAPDLFHRLLSKKPEIYLNYLEAIVYGLAREGQGVIIGHGSQILLGEFGCALHVQIHAGASVRTKNLMKQKHLSREVAQKIMLKTDQEQDGFFHYAFHVDWKDASLYDLVINTRKLGYEAAARMIMDAYRSDQITACSLDAVEFIKGLSLRRDINALLLENNIQAKWLDIEVLRKGVVTITGYIYSQEEKDKMLMIIRSIPGVTSVEEEIVTLSHLS